MNNILLDTNILIYLLNGNVALRDVLDDKNWFISFVTEMELLIKPDATPTELRAIRSIINECFVIEMSDAIKTGAIQNAVNHRLKLVDSIILASARVNDIPMITADTVFKRVAQNAPDVLLFIP